MDELMKALAWCFEHGAFVAFNEANGQPIVTIYQSANGELDFLGQGSTLVQAVEAAEKAGMYDHVRG